MSASQFELISAGWNPRVTGRVKAARAAKDGDPQACAKRARVEQDNMQQKLDKAKATYDRTVGAMAEAVKALHATKAEFAEVRAAAEPAAAQAARACQSLASGGEEAAFHAWAKSFPARRRQPSLPRGRAMTRCASSWTIWPMTSVMASLLLLMTGLLLFGSLLAQRAAGQPPQWAPLLRPPLPAAGPWTWSSRNSSATSPSSRCWSRSTASSTMLLPRCSQTPRRTWPRRRAPPRAMRQHLRLSLRFSYTLVSSNITGLLGLGALLDSALARRAQGICLQEHHQLLAYDLEHRLRQAGWHARVGAAVPSDSVKGSTGGIALMTAAHGLSELEVVATDFTPGRVMMLHCGGLCLGGYMWVGPYLKHTVGLA